MPPSLKANLKGIAAGLPQGLRQAAISAIDQGPDAPLPPLAPSVSQGRSTTVAIPSVVQGIPGLSATFPSPNEAINAIESTLPSGVPKPSQMLALPVLPGGGNGGGSTVGAAQDRPQTQLRGIDGGGGGMTSTGGYRLTE